MTASLIKNLGDVIRLLGNANILVRSIIRNAEGVGVSFQQLLDWGTALKHQRNIKNSSSQHEHESSPNELKNEVHGLRRQVGELSKEVATLKNSNVMLTKKINEINYDFL